MLSYQHIYHAGNLADVHKHALLAYALEYMCRKEKPITYIETHSGRGLYDLSDPASLKTGEATRGIEAMLETFTPAHPFRHAIEEIRAQKGPKAYPGSPLLAKTLLRDRDQMHLAELHPSEFAALQFSMSTSQAKIYHKDGFALAYSLCPPTPRRGLMLIDPSYEIKSDYDEIPRHLAKITKSWNVGVICLWYPILRISRHMHMCQAIEAAHPKTLRSEVRFTPARADHGMLGSGMLVINPPFGLDIEAKRLAASIGNT